MMLRTGNKAAFTLIEVMVTVCVLSFGILMLFRSFFISMDSVQYASNRMSAQIWIEEKMWQEIDALKRSKALVQGEESGTVQLRARDFSWRRTVDAMDSGLCRLTLDLSWKEAGRDRSLTYATYVSFL